MLDADDEADGIFARWADFGDWQARDVAGLAEKWVGLFLRKSMEKCWKLTFELNFTLKLSSKINLMMSVEKSTWQLNAA